ncbi:CDP-glucose 4,6-dehydratase [Streptomyces sp. BE303]|uniref:CDP-glucose 4,6-dehydratase n=1 Tax=Streptomyces sp. BE303 TaxID=3002528 RepID=UPI002E77CF79|nr:CDP-glucose 4,6-dehydratase [Streptomyces sp. BE303]MED7952562.1 CDP-glucose 4,6-dehydratase [Streptomyces sp. BE303]
MADPGPGLNRTAPHWRGRQVLVTGHSGFVGSWLTTALLRLGADVTGFAADADERTRARSTGLAGLGARTVVGDVRDLDAVHRTMAARPFDVVFHLAAQPLVSVGLADPHTTLGTNITGSLNVLEAVRRCAPGVLVHVTSDKCYRNRNWPWPYREIDELGGGCPYSVSKAGAELVFEAYATLLRDTGAPTRGASVRFGNIIGGGDFAVDRLVPDLLAALDAGRPVRLRRPGAVRPWQHVLDVVRGLLLLADRLADGTVATGEVLNFAPPGDGATVLDLARALDAAWVATGGRPAELSADPGTRFTEDELLRLDGRKAAELLGWRHRYDLGASAAAVVAWHRAVRAGTPPAEETAAQVEDFLRDSSDTHQQTDGQAGEQQ